jgi:phenylacetate-CoA ligase
MSDEKLMKYVEQLNEFKPRFLRGYATSIFTLASFIRDEKPPMNFQPSAVFTTSEKLLDSQRKLIEDVFGAYVFDNYGLNDGGISAFECIEHNGMHIDMERAILEVVDEKGDQIYGKPGRILATSLFNFAFPFVRYDTGDIGTMEFSDCPCGRQFPLLTGLLGRTTDVLELNGHRIGSPVLTVLFGKFDIKQYQIIQHSSVSLTCRVVKGENYSDTDEQFIKQSIIGHVGLVNIAFEYVSSINVPDGAKHKFIMKDTQRV